MVTSRGALGISVLASVLWSTAGCEGTTVVDSWPSDWFSYAVQRIDGRNTQLIVDVDGGYVIVDEHARSSDHGVLTAGQRDTVDRVLSASANDAFESDSLDDESCRVSSERPAIHTLSWTVVSYGRSGWGCWGEAMSLAHETQQIIQVLDQLTAIVSSNDPTRPIDIESIDGGQGNSADAGSR